MAKEISVEKKKIVNIYLGIVEVITMLALFVILTPVNKIESSKTQSIEEPAVARIDFSTTLVNENEPQFEVYVDDSEEPLQQTSWMPKHNEQGYSIQRLGNEMNIRIIILNDANIKVALRGPDKRDRNNKIIENWVKYTSVTIDNKEILSEPTEVWHNKPFIYTINANTGKENKINVKWNKSQHTVTR